MAKKKPKKNCKGQPRDKIRIMAGKHIGRFGECRRETESGDCMGQVMLIGDVCHRKLWKTSIELLTDESADKAIAWLAVHLSGMTMEEVVCTAQWRSPSK
jgi:hypothetical protein